MEIAIVICLLVVIALLLQDKIVIRRQPDRKEKPEPNKILPEIMGSPKAFKRHVLPNDAHEGQYEKPMTEEGNFDIETKEDGFDVAIPPEELDDVFDKVPDLYEEEEEWSRYGPPNGEDGFAIGVTFDELSAAQALLQQEKLEPALEKQVADTVQKIQGTDLFSLLEQAIPDASQKIARLLEKSLNSQTGFGPSVLRNNHFENFDIGDFA